MDTQDDRGWVHPVDDGGSATPIDPITPTGRTISSSVVAGIVLMALIVAAVVGTVIWRNRQGDPFASARSIPASMDMVVTFDALALSDSERLQAFVDAFAEPMLEAGMIEDYPDDLVAAFDEAMEDETGFTLSGDVFSWIGRSASFAMSVPDIDVMTAEVNEVDALLSVDVRDRAAADAFVDKILDEMGSEGIEVTTSQIGGLAGYTWVDEMEPEFSVGLVLTDDTLLVGMEDSIADAIQARDAGLSIAEDAVFQDTMDRLPSDNMMSVYLGPGLIDGFADIAADMAPDAQPAASEELFEAIGIAATLVDEGVRVSAVMTGIDGLVDSPVPDLRVLRGLPDDTIGFMSVVTDESVSEPVDLQALEDLAYPLEEFEAQFGIDIISIIESLSGDFSLAITETRDSFIAETSDVPLGFVGAIGVTDPDPLGDVVDLIEEMLNSQGADFDRSGGVTTVSGDGMEILSYSLADDVLVIGTGSGLVGDVVAGEGGDLLDSALYQEIDAAVAGDGLVFYVDIERIVDLVPITRDEAAVLAPIRGMGMGGTADGDTATIEFLLLVDY